MGGLRAARAASPPPARAGRKGRAELARRPAAGVGPPCRLLSGPAPPRPPAWPGRRPAPCAPQPRPPRPRPGRRRSGGRRAGGGRAVRALRSGPSSSGAQRAAPALPAAGRLSFWEGAGEAPPRAPALIGCRPEPPAPRVPLRTLIGETGKGRAPPAHPAGRGKWSGEKSRGGAAAGVRLRPRPRPRSRLSSVPWAGTGD